MTNKAKRKTYYLRFSTAADADAIEGYYKDNPHPDVAIRPSELYRERASKGAALLITDTDGPITKDNIHGCSITYPVTEDTPKGPRHAWTEMGSTRITLNGFGIYPYFISSHMVHSFLFEPPEDRIIADVTDRNTGVKKLLNGLLKWQPYTPPKALKDKVEGTFVDERPPFSYFQCGPEQMPHMARFVSRIMKNPVLKNKRTGEEIVIDTSKLHLNKSLRHVVEKLAKTDLGPVDSSDAKRKLKSVHKRFMPAA